MVDTPSRDAGLIVLKWLVVTLTATMILGIVAMVWLFATRLPRPLPPLPEAITLPDGETATAFTRGRGFVAVVTAGDEILVYDPSGTELRRRIPLDPQTPEASR